MEKFFRTLVGFIIRFYWLILLAGVGASALCMPRVIHLFKNIDTDFANLLPPDFPSVKKLFQIRDKVKPKRRVAVLMESEHPEINRINAEDLKARLEADPSVGKVYLKKEGYEFFKSHQLLYLSIPDLEDIRDRLDRKIQQEKLGGLYISLEEEGKEFDLEELKEKHLKSQGIEEEGGEYFVSPNGKIYGMAVESREANLNLAQEKKFQEGIRRLASAYRPKTPDPTLKILFGESSRTLEYRALMRDLKIAGIISGALIFLPLLIRFRRPDYVLSIFLPSALGIPIGLGLSSLWIQKLTVTTSFLFAILGGLGVESGIHLFSRYYENRKGGKNMERSLLDLYESLGPAILTAVSILAVTFLLMIFGNFKGFSEFGFISGITLYILFLMYFAFFPATMVLLEKLRAIRFKPGRAEREWKVRLSPGFVRTLFGLFTLMTLLSIFAVPRLKFEYSTRKIRADPSQERLTKVKQKAVGFPVLNPAVVIIENEKQSDALDAVVEDIKKRPGSLINMARSIYSLVPQDQEKKMAVIGQMIRILSDDALNLVKGQAKADLDTFRGILKDHRPFGLEDVPWEVRRHFLGDGKNSESFYMIYKKHLVDLDDGKNAIRFRDELAEIPTPMGTFQPTNDAIVFADVIRTLFKDSRKIILISVLSIFTFVYLNFRNLKKTALIMYSIFSGLLWVLGIMYLLGIKFNLYNMVMIPAIMGMSIDNSIHIYHRYEELGRDSLGRVLGTTGISSLLASLTNAAGFIGLVFCTHGGLRSMGVIVLLGLATCLITTLVYLPAILTFLERREDSVRLASA